MIVHKFISSTWLFYFCDLWNMFTVITRTLSLFILFIKSKRPNLILHIEHTTPKTWQDTEVYSLITTHLSIVSQCENVAETLLRFAVAAVALVVYSTEIEQNAVRTMRRPAAPR